ncbi:MAG: hypothetical protein A2189_03080 [Paenibacillus sp. RIFOXYA1_FULL_44_5]|nr:MAG: hypothetical protein A2189_03080 [Paenibacillus sp. RIFOXYA1_FULL_44_5]
MLLRKKWITVVMLVMFVSAMFLSACGSSKGNAGATPGSSTLPDSGAATKTSEKPAKTVTLQMFAWTDGGYANNDVIKKFEEKNPDIKINFAGVGSQDYLTALKTKLLTGEGPDIFWSHPGSEFQALVDAGFMEDLSGSNWSSSIQEGALNVAKSNNKLYGIPINQNLIGMYYNKKIFSDLGLSIPKTWTELIRISDKIKAKGIAPFTFALGDWPKNFMAYPLQASIIMSKNANWYKDRTAGKVSFTDWVPIYDKYMTLLKNYTLDGANGAFGVKYDAHLSNLLTGKAAMLVQGTWAYTDMLKIDPKAQVGMFAINGLDDPSGLIVPQGVGSIASVYAKSPNKDAAKKFIEFLSTPDSILNKNDIPVIKGIKTVPDFVKDLMPLVDQGKSSVFMDVPFPAGFGDALNNDVDKIITSKESPAVALKDLDKAWDDIIKKQQTSK